MRSVRVHCGAVMPRRRYINDIVKDNVGMSRKELITADGILNNLNFGMSPTAC